MLTSSDPHKLNISLPKHKGNLQQPQPFAVGREVKFLFCWFCDWSGQLLKVWLRPERGGGVVRGGRGHQDDVHHLQPGQQDGLLAAAQRHPPADPRGDELHWRQEVLRLHGHPQQHLAAQDQKCFRQVGSKLHLSFFYVSKNIPWSIKTKTDRSQNKKLQIKINPLTDLPGQQLLLHNFTLSHPQSQNDSDGFHK